MSTGPGPDGARGYTAEQGLKAVLGGENIDKMNKREGAMTSEEMRKYIMAAPDMKNVSYSDEARRYAKAILIWAEKNPEKFQMELHEKYPRFEEIKGDYDLTGFMQGWAVNAVIYVLGENTHPNPAIVTITKSK